MMYLAEKDLRPYVIGFNGPPRSGKDSIADALRDIVYRRCDIATHRAALSMPMRYVVYDLIGEIYTTKHYEDFKDVPNPLFKGETIRQAIIRLSEEFVKPTYGVDYWARYLHHQNRLWWGKVPCLMVISDIGFQEECDYFREHSYFKNVHVHRNGIDWKNDSRTYVDGDAYLHCSNNETIEFAAERIFDQLVNLGWDLQLKG